MNVGLGQESHRQQYADKAIMVLTITSSTVLELLVREAILSNRTHGDRKPTWFATQIGSYRILRTVRGSECEPIHCSDQSQYEGGEKDENSRHDRFSYFLASAKMKIFDLVAHTLQILSSHFHFTFTEASAF